MWKIVAIAFALSAAESIAESIAVQSQGKFRFLF